VFYLDPGPQARNEALLIGDLIWPRMFLAARSRPLVSIFDGNLEHRFLSAFSYGRHACHPIRW